MLAKILVILNEKNSSWTSIDELGEIFGENSIKVVELIEDLRSEGYPVEESPDKGYRLAKVTDLLSPEEVLPGLANEVFGRRGYYYFPEIDSTNIRAQQLAISGAAEGTIVVAEKQTAGRGRRGRSWYSPANQGIYVTLILRPNLPLPKVSRVSLVAAVAVAETLESQLNLAARIKWPNDVLINGKKIAGILSEAAISSNRIDYLVTGIGLNINNYLEEFPDDLRTAPTSVLAENKSPVSRVKVLQGLLERFEKHYFRLLDDDFLDTLEKGKRLSQAIGQDVRFDTLDGYVIGRAIDLDADGSLLVVDDSGIIHTVISGEVAIIEHND